MDPQQKEQDNQKGNSGAVDHIISAVNNARKARKAFKLFKRLRTAWAAAEGVTAFIAAGWPVLIAIGIVFAFVFILLLSGFTSGGTTPPPIPGGTQPIPGLTLKKDGPSSVGNGEKIKYTISGTYTGNEEVIIKDPIPSKTDLVDSETTGTHRVENNTVIWPLKDNPTIGNTYAFTLTVLPKENDIIVSNKAFGEIVGGGGNGVLDYTISFRDSSVMPQDPQGAKSAVKNEFSAAQLQYWDTIVNQSKANNWNPAFVLSLWIEETGASHHTKITSGGGGVPVGTDKNGNPIYSNGHLGCAPQEDQNIDESLRCLFRNFSSYENSQFESFMRRYSGEASSGPFVVNPNFPSRIKRYYSLLVPSGIIPINH